ncbi:uncharacterized protein LOC119372161 [Rhipicephalus sanguineus]|uniref:uncharacterized protein LOC119372161 n=1 Tax=Rhipicephalus sanguineus TaxID=34632 RepID=UPI0020C5664A|nr:uncharacterized protein LOC119372161 [Rhipicephalus sanguineus]
MATTSMTKCAGAALLFAALVAGQGGGNETFCDKQDVAACYWGFADRFGKIPLLGRNENKTSYLTNLCTSTPSDFPDPNFCKQYRYGRCTEAEIKEFTRMERGYAALRGEITSAKNCECKYLPEYLLAGPCAFVHEKQNVSQVHSIQEQLAIE